MKTSIVNSIVRTMDQLSTPLIKGSLFIIFFWFGVLKPLGISAAQELVLDTVYWMPFLSPRAWLDVIGYWEMLIGICFLFKRTIKIALVLLFLQMTGTFMPLFILPHITFQEGMTPYAPTLEGQYIIKNIIIISAAMVIGGRTLRKTQP
ncbi:MAG: hypothetical protein CBE26_00135 [Kiritimatiellaceae bacterium TMED266]|nr:MAG: hypothetical protein CBE26_00135 [Kiritimatiellaceae bacterium TMED266]